MTYKVLGIKPISYTSKKSGQLVQGTELHCTFEDKNVNGNAVDKIFIPMRIEVKYIEIGDNINVFYNRFGSVDFIEVI